ncbi:MAG: hypothetical protein IH852_09195 [Bacteroidetes bacterium]|nr:hypothetical protein [Bacteroidota bacterium]
MFDFLQDIGNYEQRKIARYEKDTLMIDTCSVSDGNKPFETAIKHPDYRNGEWIIVEAYNTISEAKAGHKRWCKTMQKSKLPIQIADCANSHIEQFIEPSGRTFKREKQGSS